MSDFETREYTKEITSEPLHQSGSVEYAASNGTKTSDIGADNDSHLHITSTPNTTRSFEDDLNSIDVIQSYPIDTTLFGSNDDDLSKTDYINLYSASPGQFSGSDSDHQPPTPKGTYALNDLNDYDRDDFVVADDSNYALNNLNDYDRGDLVAADDSNDAASSVRSEYSRKINLDAEGNELSNIDLWKYEDGGAYSETHYSNGEETIEYINPDKSAHVIEYDAYGNIKNSNQYDPPSLDLSNMKITDENGNIIQYGENTYVGQEELEYRENEDGTRTFYTDRVSKIDDDGNVYYESGAVYDKNGNELKLPTLYYGMTEEAFSKELDNLYMNIMDADYNNKGKSLLELMKDALNDLSLINDNGIEMLSGEAIRQGFLLSDTIILDQEDITDYIADSTLRAMNCVMDFADCLAIRSKIKEEIALLEEERAKLISNEPERFREVTVVEKRNGRVLYGKDGKTPKTTKKQVETEAWRTWRSKLQLLDERIKEQK